jgi:hypothetical protein
VQVLKSVGVLSAAKVMGLIYACLGLIFVPIFLLAGLFGAMAGDKAAAFRGVVGMVMAFAMPVLYGGMGFIMGDRSGALQSLRQVGWGHRDEN